LGHYFLKRSLDIHGSNIGFFGFYSEIVMTFLDFIPK
jgi:hypothetical protein